MEAVIDETIDPEELKLHGQKYDKEVANGKVEYNTAFDYGWCLVRSRKQEDVMRGIEIFKYLYKNGEQAGRRDCLFFTAVGYTKIREFELALECIDTLLKAEPGNMQAKDLKRVIEDRLKKSGLIGMGLVALGGATVLGAMGLVALLAKKK
ncbi:mitochondrial fission 1 protein-like [Paramacrobiotus metropolitanus]|uniref:mitochondrial fission 1 protein-like n=1 Tax=Paramacrobiotus metropolitanus TaxID=2943436 RepID=UPI002445B4D1|nr:mitochondrial fission 1 protein-like [Paramacrobiotus metropolitanus]